MLSVRVDRPAEDLVVIAVAGEIGFVTAPKLSTSLHRELERQPAALILDLTAVVSWASPGYMCSTVSSTGQRPS